MLDSFSIQTRSGKRYTFTPFLILGNYVRWIRETEIDSASALIEMRQLPKNARRREVIAAFRK